jgi:hypothetical protein
MIPPRSTKRLVQLFERDLRGLEPEDEPDPTQPKKRRVSDELEETVVKFAAEVRTSGSTPEQMLVELKQALSRAAPEVPTSQRNVLVARVTGRAINAFFDSSEKKSED